MSDRLLYQSETEQLVLERGIIVAEPEVPFSRFLGASGIQGIYIRPRYQNEIQNVKIPCPNNFVQTLQQMIVKLGHLMTELSVC